MEAGVGRSGRAHQRCEEHRRPEPAPEVLERDRDGREAERGVQAIDEHERRAHAGLKDERDHERTLLVKRRDGPRRPRAAPASADAEPTLTTAPPIAALVQPWSTAIGLRSEPADVEPELERERDREDRPRRSRLEMCRSECAARLTVAARAASSGLGSSARRRSRSDPTNAPMLATPTTAAHASSVSRSPSVPTRSKQRRAADEHAEAIARDLRRVAEAALLRPQHAHRERVDEHVLCRGESGGEEREREPQDRRVLQRLDRERTRPSP